MKKLVMVVTLLSASNVFAWEFPLNPDRFPSVGAALTGVSRTGTEHEPMLGRSRDFDGKSAEAGADVRLPLSNSFTLQVGGFYDNYPSKYNMTTGLTEVDYSSHEIGATVSGRYYFNK